MPQSIISGLQDEDFLIILTKKYSQTIDDIGEGFWGYYAKSTVQNCFYSKCWDFSDEFSIYFLYIMFVYSCLYLSVTTTCCRFLSCVYLFLQKVLYWLKQCLRLAEWIIKEWDKKRQTTFFVVTQSFTLYSDHQTTIYFHNNKVSEMYFIF